MVRGKSAANPIPVYFQLQTEILNKIENRHWAPGERIPPEREMAETYRVSVGTIKKAILNLVTQGYLYRIQGKGTFVAGTTLPRESLRYYRMLKDFSDREARLKIKFLNIDLKKGRMPHNRLLRIRPEQNLYELRRIFYLGKKPMVYSVSYLPCNMFPDFHRSPVSLFEEITLYEALEEKYGVPTLYNRELFKAAPADAKLSGLLEVPRETPLISIDMLSYTYKDKPYEYRQSFCVTGDTGVFREI